MKVYHGTSADNLPSILENGFNGHLGEQVWRCSSGYNYFWSPRHLMKTCGIDTIEDAINEAKRQAKESAEAALWNAKDCRRVVLEVDVPRSELSKDTSCQNMDGALLASSPVSADRITGIWIDGEPLDLFRGYFIACGMGRELRCHMELSNIEKTIGEIFHKSHDAMSTIFEKLSDMELAEYSPLDKAELVCKSECTI